MRVCPGIQALIPPFITHTKTKYLQKNILKADFNFFFAYHGFWLSLSWLVQCGVFVWDIFPLLSLTERKQQLLS